MIEDRLSGRTALFWAPPRGRGPMPRSLWRWAFGHGGKHAGLADGSAALLLVLHCINTYKDGCSASEARQAEGGCRGAVVTGTHLAEAVHRLALWVGGLSTVGAICTLPQGPTVLRRAELGLLGFLGSLAQCREDGRKIRHHRSVAAFVDFHVADAAVEAIAQRRGEARRTVRWQRGHQFDPDVPEHIEAHGDCPKFGCFHGEALTVRC